MLRLEQILPFLVASVLVTLSPGPDVLATISIGLSRGWRAAVSFGTGCGAGCLLHTGLAVLGASAVLKSSPAAYTALKTAGAIYLAWLGWGALRAGFGAAQRSHESLTVNAQQEPVGTVRMAGSMLQRGDFFRGLFANATNPKVALFFLSFLPPFVRPGQTSAEVQLAFLGAIFTVQAIVIFAVLGFFSGHLGGLLKSRPGISVWLDRLCGLLFLILAVLLLTSGLGRSQ